MISALFVAYCTQFPYPAIICVLMLGIVRWALKEWCVRVFWLGVLGVLYSLGYMIINAPTY